MAMIGRHYHLYVNEDSINATDHTQWNPKLKADNRKRTEKANAFSETLRGTINSFIQDGYTQRQIVDELNRIGVKTSREHGFQLTTLQRVMKRLGLSRLYSK
jgi:hypothetical protein